MELTGLLSPSDAARASRVFLKLARHDISRWALTGGLAIEIHMRRLGFTTAVARTARLAWDLAENLPVPAKFARDCLRLIETMDLERVETAWRDHRKPGFPLTFEETAQRLRTFVDSRADLLTTPKYSNDVNLKCECCHATKAFQLADPSLVLGLLGYC